MRLPKFDYRRPESIHEACTILHDQPSAKVLAGGTDLLVNMKHRVETPSMIVSLKGLSHQDYVRKEKGMLRIGALTPLKKVYNDPFVAQKLPALAMAKEKARGASCANNLKQIGIGLVLYSDENRDQLVPAEYDVRHGAKFQEGWPTLLYNGKYLPAERSKTFYTVAESSMVFRCPSALPKVYRFGPSSRDDPEGAMAWPYASESTGKRFHIDCWYGINGSTGNPEKWPFVRLPMDRSRSMQNNKLSSAGRYARMPAIFDGFWIHNGKDERINARHSKGTRSNLLFFDSSVRAYDTFRIPSVRDKDPGDIQWRFPAQPAN